MIIGGERSGEWPEADSLTCCRMMMRTMRHDARGLGAGFPRDHRSVARRRQLCPLSVIGMGEARGPSAGNCLEKHGKHVTTGTCRKPPLYSCQFFASSEFFNSIHWCARQQR